MTVYLSDYHECYPQRTYGGYDEFYIAGGASHAIGVQAHSWGFSFPLQARAATVSGGLAVATGYENGTRSWGDWYAVMAGVGHLAIGNGGYGWFYSSPLTVGSRRLTNRHSDHQHSRGTVGPTLVGNVSVNDVIAGSPGVCGLYGSLDNTYEAYPDNITFLGSRLLITDYHYEHPEAGYSRRLGIDIGGWYMDAPPSSCGLMFTIGTPINGVYAHGSRR